MLNTKEVLFYFSMKYQGEWESIYHAIMTKEKVEEDVLRQYQKECQCKYFTILDEEFPVEWKRIHRPPFVIYYQGNLDLLKEERKIAVVGTRNPSTYYENIAATLSYELATLGVTIISGMAKGIDTIAHQSSMRAQGKTIAILGSGILFPYPKNNEELYRKLCENQLVLSEYPQKVLPMKHHFPFRNRLVVGLSKGLLAVQAKPHSGTGISVQYVVEQNISVFCPPSLFREESANNLLLRQGAVLTENVEDIFQELNWLKKAKENG